MDLVIGAHDHVKLTTPVVVTRPGAPPAWIVETGCWGRYLGRVDMNVTPRVGETPSHVELVRYGLTQMDRSVPEDPVINSKITQLEKAIEARMGPVFTDHIASSQMELERDGTESTLGNFVTDAYRNATGADLALDIKAFVYDSLHTGTIDSVDMYNSNPAVYNPKTGKNWTLKTLPIQGKTLSWVFHLLLFQDIPAVGALYTSGVNIVFNGTPKPANPVNPTSTYSLMLNQSTSTPQLFSMAANTPDNEGQNPGDLNSTIREISIGGHPLNDNQTYLLTGGGGIFESIETANAMIPGIIPTTGIKDTGIESWQAAADYIKEITPVTPDKVLVGTRVQTLQPDLGIYDSDVSYTPLKIQNSKLTAKITVTVHNFGETTSPQGAYLILAKNRNGNNLALTENYANLTKTMPIGEIAPGGTQTFEATVTLTPDRGVFSVSAMIRGNDFEVNHGNDDVTRYFIAP